MCCRTARAKQLGKAEGQQVSARVPHPSCAMPAAGLQPAGFTILLGEVWRTTVGGFFFPLLTWRKDCFLKVSKGICVEVGFIFLQWELSQECGSYWWKYTSKITLSENFFLFASFLVPLLSIFCHHFEVSSSLFYDESFLCFKPCAVNIISLIFNVCFMDVNNELSMEQ